jgi:hypothetical protein
MATIAGFLDRLAASRIYDQAASHTRVRPQDDPFRIRAVANEDIYFFAKRIDNSQVVRQADPRAGNICWRLIGAGVSIAVMLVALSLPILLGMVEGYRIEALRQEKERLLSDRAVLELGEAKLLSPERLERLALKQSFVDPDPQKIVYLTKPDGALAKRVQPAAGESDRIAQ